MASRKQERKAGRVHTTSAQEPERQQENEDHTNEHNTGKPDFDEKDSNISPRRKAPGPDKSSQNRSGDSEENRPQPARDQAAPQPPEAKIEDDLPPESGNGS